MGFPWLSFPKINQHCSKWQPLLPDVSHLSVHLHPQKRNLTSVVPKYKMCLTLEMWRQLAECVTKAHMPLCNLPTFPLWTFLSIKASTLPATLFNDIQVPVPGSQSLKRNFKKKKKN